MSEILKATKAKAEMLFKDEKDFLTVLPILGLRGVLASMRTHIELSDSPKVYSMEPTVPQQSDGKSAIAYSEAA